MKWFLHLIVLIDEEQWELNNEVLKAAAATTVWGESENPLQYNG